MPGTGRNEIGTKGRESSFRRLKWDVQRPCDGAPQEGTRNPEVLGSPGDMSRGQQIGSLIFNLRGMKPKKNFKEKGHNQICSFDKTTLSPRQRADVRCPQRGSRQEAIAALPNAFPSSQPSPQARDPPISPPLHPHIPTAGGDLQLLMMRCPLGNLLPSFEIFASQKRPHARIPPNP